MKLITETIEDVQILTEEKNGKKNLYIEGTFLQGEIKNRNGRMYPIATLAREVQKYNESFIKSGRALGELGHPDGPTVNLDRVSHLITSLVQEGNNFRGKARILDTPMGNIARSLLDEGVKLGVSSRGIGSLREARDGAKIVADDFMLATAAEILPRLRLLSMALWKVKSGYGTMASFWSQRLPTLSVPSISHPIPKFLRRQNFPRLPNS